MERKSYIYHLPWYQCSHTLLFHHEWKQLNLRGTITILFISLVPQLNSTSVMKPEKLIQKSHFVWYGMKHLSTLSKYYVFSEMLGIYELFSQHKAEQERGQGVIQLASQTDTERRVAPPVFATTRSNAARPAAFPVHPSTVPDRLDWPGSKSNKF